MARFGLLKHPLKHPLKQPLRKVFKHGFVTNPPGPPPPLGPLNKLVPGDLNGTEFEYTTTYDFLHCRIGAVNAGGLATPDISVEVDGNVMDFIGLDTRAIAGHPIAIAFYIDMAGAGLTPGTHTITITSPSGVIVDSAIRMGELVSQSGIGAVSDPSVQSTPNYYIELYCDQGPSTSQFGSIAVFNSESGFPISASFNDDPQWTDWQDGMSVRFATDAGPSGEGGDPSLYVYYSAGSVNLDGAALVYEILNATLPP